MKLMRYLLLSIFTVLQVIFQNCYGQKPVIKSITYLPSFNRVYDIKNTIENCTVLLCNGSNSYITDVCANTEYALVKLDSNGTLIWKKCVPNPINGVFNNLFANQDSTIFLFGTRYGLGNSVIEKYDKNGNIIFTKQLVSEYEYGYNGNKAISNFEVNDNYIYVLNQASSSTFNFLLQKYNSNGDLINQKLLPNEYYSSGAYQKNSFIKIRNNGDLLLYSVTKGANPVGRLQCFDANFNLIWTKELSPNFPNSLIEAGNTEIFLATSEKLTRFNGVGDILEEKMIGYNFYEIEYGYNPPVLSLDFDGKILFYEKFIYPSQFLKISKIMSLESSIWERNVYGNIYFLQFLPKKSGGYLGLFRKNFFDIDGFPTNNSNKIGIINFYKEYQCPDFVDFSRTTSFSFINRYYSLTSTELKSTFDSGSKSEFQSEKTILLLPGCNINSGSVFKAEINTCY